MVLVVVSLNPESCILVRNPSQENTGASVGRYSFVNRGSRVYGLDLKISSASNTSVGYGISFPQVILRLDELSTVSTKYIPTTTLQSMSGDF